MGRPRKADASQQEQPIQQIVVQATEAETRYSAASLRRNALQLFQVNPEIVDGALYGSNHSEFTIVEAQEKITAYLYREVK